MSDLSEYIKSINETKQDVFDEKTCPPMFIVNRCLSYFTDCILYVNEINRYPHLSQQQQYDFLRLSLRKRKRFSKWVKKPEVSELQSCIMKLYQCSLNKAKDIEKILSDRQKEECLSKCSIGGTQKP